jgi:hypothetical protein
MLQAYVLYSTREQATDWGTEYSSWFECWSPPPTATKWQHSAPADMSAGLGRFRVGIRVREFPGLDLPHLTTSD